MTPGPPKIPSYGRSRKRRVKPSVLIVIGAAAAGTGVVLATNEDFRNQVIGSAKALGDEIIGSGARPSGSSKTR